MSLKLQDGGDVRDYSRRFFDTVDRLAELHVEINQELLIVNASEEPTGKLRKFSMCNIIT